MSTWSAWKPWNLTPSSCCWTVVVKPSAYRIGYLVLSNSSFVRFAGGKGYWLLTSALWISPHIRTSTCFFVGAVVTTIAFSYRASHQSVICAARNVLPEEWQALTFTFAWGLSSALQMFRCTLHRSEPSQCSTNLIGSTSVLRILAFCTTVSGFILP